MKQYPINLKLMVPGEIDSSGTKAQSSVSQQRNEHRRPGTPARFPS
jgi:hypothetical protein